MKNIHYPPVHKKGEFHCPHCNVFAKQFWAHLQTLTRFEWTSFVDNSSKFDELLPKDWAISKCQHCANHIIWFQDKIIYPRKMITQLPNQDLDKEIIGDYTEAAMIFQDSPRAAAALLRLALQKLCKQLGEKVDNINDDIKNLVSKGLNSLVQKSLDSLRIT